MSEEKKKRKYKGKPTGWSKSKDKEQIDNPNKENPSQEDDMDEKEIQDLIDKSNEKMIDMLNKKFGGNTSPGGEKMDQDTKDYLEKLNRGVTKQGEMLEKLFGEQQQEESEKRFGELIQKQIKPLKDAQDNLNKELRTVKKLVCNDDGTVCFFTKEELESWKKEQTKELENIKGKTKETEETNETKKTEETKPDLSQYDGQELWNQIKKNKTYEEDVGKIFLKKIEENPDYKTEALNILKKIGEVKEEKTPEGKKFFLSKK